MKRTINDLFSDINKHVFLLKKSGLKYEFNFFFKKLNICPKWKLLIFLTCKYYSWSKYLEKFSDNMIFLENFDKTQIPKNISRFFNSFVLLVNEIIHLFSVFCGEFDELGDTDK